MLLNIQPSPLVVCIAPSPVLNLTVSSVQERSCLLTWAAPQWMNGDFEYYSIRLYGDVIHHSINDSSTDVHYSCKELEEGTHYNVSVVAVSEHGEGNPSYTDFTTSISRKCPRLISLSYNLIMHLNEISQQRCNSL